MSVHEVVSNSDKLRHCSPQVAESGYGDKLAELIRDGILMSNGMTDTPVEKTSTVFLTCRCWGCDTVCTYRIEDGK